MPSSSVRKIHAAGFRIGPGPDETHACGHTWGGHILDAPGSPLDGGMFRCPVCPCTGTWDVSGPTDEQRKDNRGRYLS